MRNPPVIRYDRCSRRACAADPTNSSVAQRQSIRLLTGGLLVRIQPEEPIFSTVYERLRKKRAERVPNFVPTFVETLQGSMRTAG